MFTLGLVLLAALILISSARSEIFEGEIPSILSSEVTLIEVSSLHCEVGDDFIVAYVYEYLATSDLRAVELYLSSDLENEVILIVGEEKNATIFVRTGSLVEKFKGWDAFETAYPTLCEINFNNET